MEKLKSRKFWAAVIGAFAPIVVQAMTGAVGWQEALMMTAGVLSSYVFGQAYVDGQAAAAIK